MAEQLGITAKKEDNFSEWYTQAITKAELIDYSSVSGCMVIRPYGYAIWEKIQSHLDGEFKKRGVKNAYFPLFIPETLLTKEAEHVEGFAPEVAWVTHGGDSELAERLAIRPTSETIMYESYAKWIRSHRDLPLLINQWCNVVRWEFKHPVPFLRTREFLWQEGHTAHATKEGASAEAADILEVYANAFSEVFAVPMWKGQKSAKEKFAGADYTLSVETLFPNGKAIQGATSHFLGQNFAKAFGIEFLDDKEQRQHVWQNSWGFSTRSIGIMIGVHGDDKGLVLPPKAAPIPVVVVPIVFAKKPEASEKILSLAKKLASSNSWELDDREGYSPGFKFNEWELKGVPVRVEIGPRDLESDSVTLVRRDTGEKEQVAVKDAPKRVLALLDDIQASLLKKREEWLSGQVVDVSSVEDLKKVVSKGKIGRAPWCGSPESEERIKAATGAKSLNGELSGGAGACFEDPDCKAIGVFLFGKSY
jgi:prolyl-tRNA synthetase